MKYCHLLLPVILVGSVFGSIPCASADEGDCDILSSTKLVDYGRFRQGEMRRVSAESESKIYRGYASVSREVQVSVICPDDRKIRLYVDGPVRQSKVWQFSDKGVAVIKVRNARVDGTLVQLTSSPRGNGPTQGGTSEVTLSPESAISFVNGQEVIGKQWVATLMITTYLSDNAFKIGNSQDLEETLTVSFDAVAIQ
ncbi:hypothetical protein NOX22_21240 [Enterobacter cloacae]|uniref:hypothetical protein n=1 Tax=Enterobacter cloacae complex TaxID=354276 RepID=UPI00210AD289|nr:MULTISPECIES: hypothetical protein [Enterobacter cloacae complex]MCQ4447076.1 hypothetical protein [Enterobacter cloacae]MDW2867891.1 hypothetical protein [Enterobacter hormaechei]